MVSTFVVSVICQINFGKGLRKYLVERVKKEKDAGYVSYDLDENTEYKGLSPQGTGKGRVILE